MNKQEFFQKWGCYDEDTPIAVDWEEDVNALEEEIRADERTKIKNALYERAREKGIYMSEYIAFIDCAFEQMKGEQTCLGE